MEAKGRKMLALGIVAMLCAVAIVGIGYAAFGGSAKTYNQDNAATAGYMTLTPQGATVDAKWEAITTASDVTGFDTYAYAVLEDDDDDPGTPDVLNEYMAYFFVSPGGSAGTGVANNYTVQDINSKTFRLTNQTGSAITSVKFDATASQNAPAGNFVYFLKVTVGAASPVYMNINTVKQQTDAIAIASVASGASVDIQVAICIGYVANIYIPDNYVGPAGDEDVGRTIPAIKDGTGPVGLTATSFSFGVTDFTA